MNEITGLIETEQIIIFLLQSTQKKITIFQRVDSLEHTPVLLLIGHQWYLYQYVHTI